MAIQLKKKPAAEVISNDDKAALIAAGLLPEPEKPKGIVIKRTHQFSMGDRVIVTNSMYHWVKHYQKGDIGTVVKLSSVAKAPGDPMPSVTLYHVLLDNPRVSGMETVILAGWELEDYGND